MYSRLPGQFGGAPAKVVFESVEPGSALAQRLYHEHQATITQFHVKARQSRNIGGQYGASMQQAMPDQGQLRYSYNGGQETIHVRLHPKVLERVSKEPLEPVLIPTPQLAIDVIYTSTQYMAGDIYSWYPAEGAGHQHNFRNQSEMFTVYNAVGLIGNPDASVPVEAGSRGVTVEHPGAQLHSIIDESADTTALREFVIDSEDFLAGGVGAGFLATMPTPRAPPGQPGQLTIDVYMASLSVARHNDFAGHESENLVGDDAITGPDHDDYVYDVQEVRVKIRVREMVEADAKMVKVIVVPDRRDKHYIAADDFATTHPDILETTNPGTPFLVEWTFAAQGGWEDLGGEPADPLAPKMGKLLDETPWMDLTVVGKDPPAREIIDLVVFTATPEDQSNFIPKWTQKITDMTKIATIAWTTSGLAHVNGKATVTPA